MHKDFLLQISNLHVQFNTRAGVVKALNGVDLSIHRGETLGLVGESGCGKSMTARAILGIVPRPGRITQGRVLLNRKVGDSITPLELSRLHPKGSLMREVRQKDISIIFQEPMTSLSPVHTIGNQIIEAINLHTKTPQAEARRRAIEALDLVGIPNAKQRIDSYPFELSGGMRQRAMIAMALSCNPSLLIADEPTTALDVTIQAQILELIQRIQEQMSMTNVLITHNLGVVAALADRIAVMYLGRIVEEGTKSQIFSDPKHPYTQGLLKSVPKVGQKSGQRLWSIEGSVPDPYNQVSGCPFHPRCPSFMAGVCDSAVPSPVSLEASHTVSCFLYSPKVEEALRREAAVRIIQTTPDKVQARQRRASNDVLFEVRDLKKHFPIKTGLFQRQSGSVRAVDGVNFRVYKGETLGLVGESGCGKTTTARALIRAIEPTAGKLLFAEGKGSTVDLMQLEPEAMRQIRRRMQMIFQDPYASLNPRMTIQEIISEPLVCHEIGSPAERKERVAQMLEIVGLDPKYMSRYPHAFSGGQRQRIGIARALSINPDLVIADEAVSALDVSIQAQVLNLMQDLQEEFDLTYLFIAHDLGVVEHVCDRVVVMYLGKVVEMASTEDLFHTPKHPYVEALLSAVPRPDPNYKLERMVLEGEVGDPSNRPDGCAFHPRCPYAEAICRSQEPPLVDINPDANSDHWVACHLAQELSLLAI